MVAIEMLAFKVDYNLPFNLAIATVSAIADFINKKELSRGPLNSHESFNTDI
jgi:hypothetical protein